MIFCHSGSLGCDSALSGSSPQLCIPGFHRGRILTPLGSVFSGSATGFSQLRRFTSQVHKLRMQGMAGNAKPSSDTENVQGNGKNLLCAFGAPVNSLLWLPQTSVKVLIDLFSLWERVLLVVGPQQLLAGSLRDQNSPALEEF